MKTVKVVAAIIHRDGKIGEVGERMRSAAPDEN